MAVCSLSEVLAGVDALPWKFALFVPKGELVLTTPVLVLDPNDAEPDEEAPAEALAQGMRYFLSIQEVRSIRDNLEMQRPGAGQDPKLVCAALAHYEFNDAFMEL